MEKLSSSSSMESFPMNAGDGTYSYTHNSTYQKGGLQRTKELIDEAIAGKLDIQQSSFTSNPFTIADFGCSTGPNTFFMVQNVVEAVELKYRKHSPNSHIPEFQVYFNDHVSNDFNTLFESLPPKRQYFAAGAPGSFRARVFPKASIHFANSSYSLHWLSKIPIEVLDRKSLAWNKGKISYGTASKDVVEAFSAQFAEDTESFLNARSQELVPGGLMSIVVMGIPGEVPPSQSTLLAFFDVMASTLMDIAKMGMISEDEVDSFNIPMYNATQHEIKSLIEKNGCFTIEKIEPFTRLNPQPEAVALSFRAAIEGVFSKHFSPKVIDEFFELFPKNLASLDYVCEEANELFVLLKRKASD